MSIMFAVLPLSQHNNSDDDDKNHSHTTVLRQQSPACLVQTTFPTAIAQSQTQPYAQTQAHHSQFDALALIPVNKHSYHAHATFKTTGRLLTYISHNAQLQS